MGSLAFVNPAGQFGEFYNQKVPIHKAGFLESHKSKGKIPNAEITGTDIVVINSQQMES